LVGRTTLLQSHSEKSTRRRRKKVQSANCKSQNEEDPRTGTALPHPTRPNWFWLASRFVMRLFFAFWLRYRARGVERVPVSGGGLMLVNHQSFLDPLLAGLPFSRPVSYIARDSLFRVPVIGWILRNTYVIPINRESAGSESLRESVRRMQHGFLVGVFPEGTRSADGAVGPMKPGFIALIRRGKLPVIPVGVAGAHEAMPRNAWFPRPRRVCVVYGEPLTHAQIEPYTRRGREEELVELVRGRIIACQAEAEEWRQR
jgi:1-acyl-sn-glycerol-3-phosphate acyltransferase